MAYRDPAAAGVTVREPAVLNGATLQRALVVEGFDPGPIDGIIGERTLSAFDAFTDSIGMLDVTVRVSADERSVTVESFTLSERLAAAAARYVAPRRSGGGSTSITPAPTALRFWRASNPWAWGAAVVPLALIFGGLGFFLTRKR